MTNKPLKGVIFVRTKRQRLIILNTNLHIDSKLYHEIVDWSGLSEIIGIKIQIYHIKKKYTTKRNTSIIESLKRPQRVIHFFFEL